MHNRVLFRQTTEMVGESFSRGAPGEDPAPVLSKVLSSENRRRETSVPFVTRLVFGPLGSSSASSMRASTSSNRGPCNTKFAKHARVPVTQGSEWQKSVERIARCLQSARKCASQRISSLPYRPNSFDRSRHRGAGRNRCATLMRKVLTDRARVSRFVLLARASRMTTRRKAF